MVPAMTKNEDMYKNRVCPEDWTIKQQSASLKLPDNVVHCLGHFALHLTILLSQQTKIQFSERLLDYVKNRDL